MVTPVYPDVMDSPKVASSSSLTTSGDQRLSNNVLLTNAERNALHVEIYSYFEWLMIQVEKSEEEEAAVADYSASSLRELLSKLESTFTVVGYGKVDTNTTNAPLLESSLQGKLLSSNRNNGVEESTKKRKRSAENNMEQWTQLDFDIMFDKLVTYKNEHGHSNVPVKYTKDVQLGSWVSGLRSMKKAWDSGDEIMDKVAAAIDDGGASTTTLTSQKNSITTYLNIERIQKLASIGFVWDKSKLVVLKRSEKKSFNERLVELQSYHNEHGKYTVPRNSSLGEWLHTQRSLYKKRDARFMEVKAPQMIAIGYAFDLRENTSVSWEDRFQQLVEYKQSHGNFDIPSAKAIDDGYGNDDELNDKNNFYKWVRRLHNEHRAFEKGTSSKLTAQRLERLRSIGFQFNGRKYKTWHSDPVPNIPFEKRIQQLQTFLADTGTLDIDHNYKHNSNLGGWAVEMSLQYTDWKSGKTQPSQDDIAKFDQLTTLGFQFNIVQHYGTQRSWEDQYNALVKFKERNGNVKVPYKYKADLRLGKWVQVQRQDYKLIQEGKKSKLTDDRIQKLLSLDAEFFV